MIRRFIAVVLSVCFVLALFVVPVSAYYVEGPSSRNFLFPFEYIAGGPTQGEVWWTPFGNRTNSSAYGYTGEFWYPTANDIGANISQSNLQWSVLTRENTSTNAILEALVSPKATNVPINNTYSIKLRAFDFVFPTSTQYNYNLNFGENNFPSNRSHVFDVTGSFTVFEYTSSSNTYSPKTYNFNASWAGGVNCEVGNMVRNAIDSVPGIVLSNYQYIYINDLVVSFTTSAVELLADGLYMTISSRGPASLPTISNFVNQYTFRGSSSGDTDFTGWLSVAIGSFLRTELWPGFSIDKLLFVVLAIALVITVCTLLI